MTDSAITTRGSFIDSRARFTPPAPARFDDEAEEEEAAAGPSDDRPPPVVLPTLTVALVVAVAGVGMAAAAAEAERPGGWPRPLPTAPRPCSCARNLRKADLVYGGWFDKFRTREEKSQERAGLSLGFTHTCMDACMDAPVGGAVLRVLRAGEGGRLHGQSSLGPREAAPLLPDPFQRLPQHRPHVAQVVLVVVVVVVR